jgi:probable DNA repair protein
MLSADQKILSLKSCDLILTPNQRLAAKLRHQLNQHHLDNGDHFWQLPTILPIKSWSIKLWQELQGTESCIQILLNPYQERNIWQQIIDKTFKDHDLLHRSTIAKPICTAWQLCQQWQIDIDHPSFQMKEDCEFFILCVKEYKLLCAEKGFIDIHSIPQQLIRLLKNSPIEKGKILLTGFDELIPNYAALIEHIRSLGVEIDDYNPVVLTHSSHRTSFPNHEDEIHQMALWAKNQYDQNPKAMIACVVPDLQTTRDIIEAIFYQVFQLQDYINLTRVQSIPFNISAGKPLHTFALIHIIFKALRIGHNEIDINEMGVLLRSIYIGEAQQEFCQRAICDAKLRRYNRQKLPLSQIIATASLNAPLFAKRFYDANKFIGQQKENKTAQQWCSIFSLYLEKLGWPGERAIDSEEFQIINAWKELLSHFASLDYVSGPFSFNEAVTALEEAAVQTIFQTKSDAAPIQILGILEAAGQTFDHIWIMGMHDLAWPKPAQPNPFIPFELQRKFNLPNSSAVREFQFAKRLTERFLQSAGSSIIVSYPEQLDGRETRISSLINHIEEIQTLRRGAPRGRPLSQASEEGRPQGAPLQNRINHTNVLQEIIDDDNNVPLSPEKLTKIKGGTAILKHQAACSFRAFALFRLNPQTLDRFTPGLTAAEKGALLHKALEIIWQNIQSQSTLYQLTEEKLAENLNQWIDKAINEFFIHHPFILQKRFIYLEKQRLYYLIANYLELEKQRPAFHVIATEQRQEFLVGDMKIKIQIDRIDVDNQGNHIIIDYKTNDPKIQSWFDERPDEPQLPAYCIANYQEVNALAFLQINKNKIGYKGIAETDVMINGIYPLEQLDFAHGKFDWEELKRTWSVYLTNLVSDFIVGKALVDPKNGATTCTYCQLHSLCRINHEPII